MNMVAQTACGLLSCLPAVTISGQIGDRKMDKHYLDKIKPKIYLEVKLMKLRLSYFGHIMRSQDSLEKTAMPGKVGGSKKRGRPNMRWIDFLKQGSQTVALQMFLDFNSQKAWPAEVVLEASGSCSPRTSGGPRLGTTDIGNVEV